MPKVKISKQLIEMIANKDNSKIVKNINEKVSELLTITVENLANKTSYISLENVVLQPVNELFNNAFVDGSSYVYLLGIENAQLQLNTIKKESKWKDFKKKLIFFWQNRKALKKAKKKRRRKKNKEEIKPNNDNKSIDPTKYTIFDLTEDLQQSLSNYLSETTMIYLNRNSLEIVGKDDFGPNVKIVLHIVNIEDHQFKYYTGNKSSFLNINLTTRYQYLSEKQLIVGENFTKMIKILNSLYLNVNGILPNQVFIESILCSCPDDLFEGEDIYKVYLKIINFISLKTIRKIKSINDTTKTILEDKICGTSGIGFNKLLQVVGKEKL